LEPYDYHGFEVANVVAEIAFGRNPAQRILIGAHCDSVVGTVGADDNASAVAVQLETARQVMALKGSKDLDLEIVFVSFALEEPPAYGTRYMGSRVYAEQARRRGERIDAMLCLEMVGYTCSFNSCFLCRVTPFWLLHEFDYPSDQNSPMRPCRANVAAVRVVSARSQSRLRRVAYHSAPSS
jgi:Zn-dependent M28 family amino/carboxypeptidase